MATLTSGCRERKSPVGRGHSGGHWRERHLGDQPAARARLEHQPGAVGVGDGAHDREAEAGARAVGVAMQALERLGEEADVLRRGSSDRCSRPGRSSGRVVMRTLPPMTLWRTPFSTRLATRRSISAGSPVSGALCRSVSTSTPRTAASAAVVSAAVRPATARSSGSRRGSACWLRASTISESSSTCVRSAASSTAPPMWRRSGTSASGSASATSTSARMTVSGVRSSWRGVGDEAALAVERAGEPVEHPVDGVGELAQLVVRALHRDPLVQCAPASRAGRAWSRAAAARARGRRRGSRARWPPAASRRTRARTAGRAAPSAASAKPGGSVRSTWRCTSQELIASSSAPQAPNRSVYSAVSRRRMLTRGSPRRARCGPRAGHRACGAAS